MSDRNYKVKGKKLLPKWYNKERNAVRKLKRKLWAGINKGRQIK